MITDYGPNDTPEQLMNRGRWAEYTRLAQLVCAEFGVVRSTFEEAVSAVKETISGLTRALEVARGALGRISGFDCRCAPQGWHGDNCDTGIASRALTAIDAVTGGGAGAARIEAGALALLREVADPDETDVEPSLGRVLLERGRPLHDRIIAFIKQADARSVAPGVDEPNEKGLCYACLHTPHAATGCHADLGGGVACGCELGFRAPVAGVTPGAGQAQSTCASWCGHFHSVASVAIADRARVFCHAAPATPVAQRRPAKSVPTGKRVVPIKLDPFVQALADRWWDYGEGDDHWGVLVGALSEMLAAAIEARDAEHAAAFEALEEHVACVYASEADLRMELAEAVGADALAAAPEAVSACRQHIDCVAADMAHMNAFGELASHGSLLDQARRAIDAAAPAVVPAETPAAKRPWPASAPPREGMGPGERKP